MRHLWPLSLLFSAPPQERSQEKSRIQIVYSGTRFNRHSKEYRDELERAVRDEFRQFAFRRWN